MAERSEKLSERLPLNLSEREFLDLARMAALEERTVPDFLRVRVIRPFMYGNVARLEAVSNEVASGFGDLSGPEK